MQHKIVIQQAKHTKLNDYEILERLGNQKRRKFSEVFKVRHKQTHEFFILKISSTELGRETLQAESQFSFSHPGLPQVIWCLEDEESTALLLKHQKGITLTDLFKQIKPSQKWDVVIRFCESIIPLLSALQEKNIAHLDLKPSNILIDEFTGEVSLIDFGLAIDYSLPVQRKLIFPLGYASPEVILNRLHLTDHRSDYFSLAVVLFQLFEGKLPMLHANPSIMTNLQITHPLPEADALDKKANAALQKLGAKYTFKTVPNALLKEDLDKALLLGKLSRYDKFEEFIADFKQGGMRKKWIFF